MGGHGRMARPACGRWTTTSSSMHAQIAQCGSTCAGGGQRSVAGHGWADDEQGRA
jgi:hypothetical protein